MTAFWDRWSEPDIPFDFGAFCLIIHASDSTRYAINLADYLRQKGCRTLLADASAVSEWVATLVDDIGRSDVVILVCTRGALASKWVLNQIDFVINQGIPLIPIMFKGMGFDEVPASLAHNIWLQEDASVLREQPSQETVRMLMESVRWINSRVRKDRDQRKVAPPRLEKRPLNEGKLILIGRGEVGKTSLVNRLVKSDFSGEERKTQGINITKWFIQVTNDSIRLNIWDFGGQEIMHATHQFFLTERTLYLLVLNGREGGEDADAEYWLKHIESFGADSPVIVVQNKISQHPFDLNYRGLRARYPQIRGFVKTDCKDEVGIPKLHDLIASVVADMPEIRMDFYADWYTVKERLESMGDEYLSYQQFVDLCIDQGIVDDSARDTLAFALHCLGIALNYRQDSRLRETSVLKPEWVTQGIYGILNAKRLAERHGELHLSDLRDILSGKRYPRDKHLFLLELMRKFSLCFPFRDDADRFLVPDLLGKEEPLEVATFSPGECLNFEYHYGVLPEGLLPRFIVRTHALSADQPRWRSGVVLAYEDCKALVKTEPAERRVIVRVNGGNPIARRNLLAIIRYDFDLIHAEFKDRLDVQEKVPLTANPSFSVDYKKLVAFERKKVTEFPEYVGQEILRINVSDLLNGIDFEEQRRDPLEALNRAKSLFFSYSHKDEELRDELETHLKLLQRQRIIATWHDRKILAGSEWDHEIDGALNRADIILLLVSADFIASDYCWDKEISRAMERHDSKEALVVPVLLRSCDWKGAPFGKVQGLPTDMKAVTAWSDRDAAWTNVATGIRRFAESLPPRKLGSE